MSRIHYLWLPELYSLLFMVTTDTLNFTHELPELQTCYS